MPSTSPVHTEFSLPFVGVSMRLLRQEGTGDMHSALSTDWGRFLAAVGVRWLPLPNQGMETLMLACDLGLSGFIFSGGGDAGGEPLRDTTESLLMEWAREQRLPILGVCRGFQAIQLYLKGQLVPVHGHVATTHDLWEGSGTDAPPLRAVNSYHHQGIAQPATPLEALAFSREPDGRNYVEAAWAAGLLGIMWHPERSVLPARRDVDLIRQFFAYPNDRPCI